jgi:hypothetical protein
MKLPVLTPQARLRSDTRRPQPLDALSDCAVTPSDCTYGPCGQDGYRMEYCDGKPPKNVRCSLPVRQI